MRRLAIAVALALAVRALRPRDLAMYYRSYRNYFELGLLDACREAVRTWNPFTEGARRQAFVDKWRMSYRWSE